MPSDHRLWLYYHDRGSPFEAPCQDGQADPGCGVYSTRPDAALLEQRQLSTKKKILRFDRLCWS
jgi:hypothetical protein